MYQMLRPWENTIVVRSLFSLKSFFPVGNLAEGGHFWHVRGWEDIYLCDLAEIFSFDDFEGWKETTE